jgi:hypothetical protein
LEALPALSQHLDRQKRFAVSPLNQKPGYRGPHILDDVR